MSQESPQPQSSNVPNFRQELKDLLLACSGQMKLLYRDKPDDMIATVNETLDRIDVAVKALEVDRTRLLPLVAGMPNERLANVLGNLLTEDIEHAEDGARASLMILTGIQAFQDSGGDPRTFEVAWGPVIVARDMLKKHGPNAWQIAAKISGEMKAENKPNLAELYERVAMMLAPEPAEPAAVPDVNKAVDNPS